MKIDFSGVRMEFDLVLKVFSGTSSIDVISKHEVIRNSVIEACQGMTITKFRLSPESTEEIHIYCEGQDMKAIAERIATTVELKGYSVLRLVTDPSAFDKSPKMPVQSFLLIGES